MKICIPTETKEGKQALVHGHFGSAPFFTIYELDNDSLEVIENTNAHHEHGMCQPLSVLAGVKLAGVVCRGMGAGAVMKLTSAGIVAYKTDARTVGDVVNDYREGRLSRLTVEGACAGHGCH